MKHRNWSVLLGLLVILSMVLAACGGGSLTASEYAEEIERLSERFRPLVRRCRELGRAMRIGTNHGSLSDRVMNRYGDTPEGMVESALEFLDVCEDEGYRDVVFSMKASNAQVAIHAYRALAARLAERESSETASYPFHLGVTEAGDGEDARVKSAIGIGALLEHRTPAVGEIVALYAIVLIWSALIYWKGEKVARVQPLSGRLFAALCVVIGISGALGLTQLSTAGDLGAVVGALDARDAVGFQVRQGLDLGGEVLGGCVPARLVEVVHAQEQLFSCATDSAHSIAEMIREKILLHRTEPVDGRSEHCQNHDDRRPPMPDAGREK